MSAHQALTLTGALDAEYALAQPLPITAEWRDEYVTITAPVLGLRAMGQSPEDALEDLRATIADRYRDLAGRAVTQQQRRSGTRGPPAIRRPARGIIRKEGGDSRTAAQRTRRESQRSFCISSLSTLCLCGEFFRLSRRPR